MTQFRTSAESPRVARIHARSAHSGGTPALQRSPHTLCAAQHARRHSGATASQAGKPLRGTPHPRPQAASSPSLVVAHVGARAAPVARAHAAELCAAHAVQVVALEVPAKGRGDNERPSGVRLRTEANSLRFGRRFCDSEADALDAAEN